MFVVGVKLIDLMGKCDSSTCSLQHSFRAIHSLLILIVNSSGSFVPMFDVMLGIGFVLSFHQLLFILDQF